MAKISPNIYFGGNILESSQASLHVASSAVLYGLSVYTVFPISYIHGKYSVFRLGDHVKRLQDSSKLIGIELPDECSTEDAFKECLSRLIEANTISESLIFARASIHVDELVPGTKSKGLHTILSIFLYEAKPIVPQDGVRLKTSPWRRNPDFSIPSRAKVNGGYVNSVLAKQDAIDSGYDDAIFLDTNGHVCELSAANIFILRDGVLVTPSKESDILEGINRRTIINIAKMENISVEERMVDMTELYIADEVFVTGTSAFITGVIGIDGRKIGTGSIGKHTQAFRKQMQDIQLGVHELSSQYMTNL